MYSVQIGTNYRAKVLYGNKLEKVNYKTREAALHAVKGVLKHGYVVTLPDGDLWIYENKNSSLGDTSGYNIMFSINAENTGSGYTPHRENNS